MDNKEYIERGALLKDIYNNPAEAHNERCAQLLEAILYAPAADVVEKERYDHVLELARKMHTWIFSNTYDEQAAYDEMGLTDEDNALLGYGGRVEFSVNEERGE